MRLYVDANFASPYALVAFVSLIEKGLQFEIEPLDLAVHANLDPDFARTSITRRIPTLIHDGFALSESSAICEYLDETHPGVRLYPTDPRDRARARQIQAWMRSDLMPIRDERPTFVVFCNAKRPELSERARRAADTFDLPDQHRKLDNKNRSHRDSDGKQRLRDPGGEYFVCHVTSPWIELIEQCRDCTARHCTTNAMPDSPLRNP
jgi:hypothetical protein